MNVASGSKLTSVARFLNVDELVYVDKLWPLLDNIPLLLVVLLSFLSGAIRHAVEVAAVSRRVLSSVVLRLDHALSAMLRDIGQRYGCIW